MVDFTLYILKVNLLAAVIIYLVYVLSKFVKNKYSSWWRYYMWLAVSAALIIPFGLLQHKEAVSLEIPYQEQTDETNENNPAVDLTSTGQVPTEATVNEVETKINSRVLNLSTLTLVDYTNIFMYVWIGGIIVISFIRALSYLLSLYSLRRWAVSCRDSDYLMHYRKVCKMRRMKRRPRLMINSHLPSPILAGLMRPALYIPGTDYTEQEIKMIYHHELSHYQNKDLWYKFFLLVINSVYWFNPALYLMRKEADKDIEYICDSNVIKICAGEERKAYHNLILKTAVAHRRVHYISASLNDDMTDFKERIMYMVKVKSLKKGKLLVGILAALLLVTNLVVGCSGKRTDNNDKKDKMLTLNDTGTGADTDEAADTDADSNTEKDDTAVKTEEKEENGADGSNETADINDSAAESDSKETSNHSEVDKSGDYIGNITSPNPPEDSSYRVHNYSDDTKAAVIHVSNLDSANIKFYLTIATIKEGVESDYHPDTYSESVILNEHIAHYNGDGYYEYIGDDYHLYFNYTGNDFAAGFCNITVYGLEGLFDLSQYGEIQNYNGINGLSFNMGLPFAG